MTALRLCIILALLAIVGCDTVYIDSSIGEKLSKADATKYAGRWSDDDQNYFELVVAKNGDVVAGNLSWDEKKQQFEATSTVVDIRKIDDSLCVFMTNENDSSDDDTELDEFKAESAPANETAKQTDASQKVFIRVDLIKDTEMHIFLADAKAIGRAIEAGKIDGRVQKRSKSTVVHIRASEANTKEFIASKQWATLFQKEPTFKFKLVKKASL